ncbi:MAG: DUF3800 domain-containing protein [Chloroflexi bacterium]|nr:DUF3800 domain-containing protein [Chloroflexota bacterium]
MYLCYVDESGTPDIPGNTSHYVLAGVAIPVQFWRDCDRVIDSIKAKYDLADQEIQTLQERRALVRDVAQALASWGFARLFAECVDKIHFDPTRAPKTIDEQAFEQIVSRFEQYLAAINQNATQKNFGLLIHDNNETVAKKHTLLMKRFHKGGTLWINLQNIIETPLFVNSELTAMVQLADLCGFALRRYLENQEEELFNLVFKRADRRGETVVGVRHFTRAVCACKICNAHRRAPSPG